jgi:hypothetical protein
MTDGVHGNLLPNGHVDTQHICLVENRIDDDGSFTCLAVSNDELALPTSNRNHRIYRSDPSRKGFVDRPATMILGARDSRFNARPSDPSANSNNSPARQASHPYTRAIPSPIETTVPTSRTGERVSAVSSCAWLRPDVRFIYSGASLVKSSRDPTQSGENLHPNAES